jgi:hypothetical protein
VSGRTTDRVPRLATVRWRTVDVVPGNLAALCRRCRMIHDRPEHPWRRWRTLFRRKASGDRFDGPYAYEILSAGSYA